MVGFACSAARADDASTAPASRAAASSSKASPAKPVVKIRAARPAPKPTRTVTAAKTTPVHTVLHTNSLTPAGIAAIKSEDTLPVASNVAAACGSMIMPAVALKQVSRGFSSYHSGIDLMAPYGSPIRAAEPGRVIFAGTYFGYGNMIDLVSSNGVVTRYGHMSAFAPGLHVGTTVSMGDTIGNIGTSGHAHGPHVHFEVRIGGRAVNPAPYLGLANCLTSPSSPVVEEAQAPEIMRSKMADGRPAGGFQ
jgi:murein DD-endopeptidase MepM/ murein hydrolase activator NlpD